MEQYITLVANALQLSGAILLMIKFWGNPKKRILKTYFNASKIICKDSPIIVKKEICKQAYSEIYLTRISFIYLVFGYFLSIFDSTSSLCQCKTFFFFTFSTAGLIMSAFLLNWAICRFYHNSDIEIPYNEACEIGEANEEMSKQEVEEIINECK